MEITKLIKFKEPELDGDIYEMSKKIALWTNLIMFGSVFRMYIIRHMQNKHIVRVTDMSYHRFLLSF